MQLTIAQLPDTADESSVVVAFAQDMGTVGAIMNEGTYNWCDDGEPITDETACTEAAAELGFAYVAGRELDYAPDGCFIYDGESTEERAGRRERVPERGETGQ